MSSTKREKSGRTPGLAELERVLKEQSDICLDSENEVVGKDVTVNGRSVKLECDLLDHTISVADASDDENAALLEHVFGTEAASAIRSYTPEELMVSELPEDGSTSVSGGPGAANDNFALPPRVNLLELAQGPKPEMQYLVPLYIPRQEIMTLVAKPKSGKSMVALDLALRLVKGDAVWLKDAEPCNPARVGYLDAEGNEKLLRTRLHQLESARGLTPEAAERFAFCTVQSLKLDTNEGLGSVDRFVTEHALDLLIIDSYRRFMSGEENSSDACHKMGQALMYLRDKHKLSLLVIHHMGWSEDRARGSSDLMAWSDMGLSLKVHQWNGRRIKSVRFANEYSRSGHEGDPLIIEWRPTESDRFDMVANADPSANDDQAREILLQAGQAGYMPLEHYRNDLATAGLAIGRDKSRDLLNQLTESGSMTKKIGASGLHQWVTVADSAT